MSKKEELRTSYAELKNVINNIEMDVMRVYDGNMSAAVRVRKCMQEVRKKAADMRILVSEVKYQTMQEREERKQGK